MELRVYGLKCRDIMVIIPIGENQMEIIPKLGLRFGVYGGL